MNHGESETRTWFWDKHTTNKESNDDMAMGREGKPCWRSSVSPLLAESVRSQNGSVWLPVCQCPNDYCHCPSLRSLLARGSRIPCCTSLMRARPYVRRQGRGAELRRSHLPSKLGFMRWIDSLRPLFCYLLFLQPPYKTTYVCHPSWTQSPPDFHRESSNSLMSVRFEASVCLVKRWRRCKRNDARNEMPMPRCRNVAMITTTVSIVSIVWRLLLLADPVAMDPSRRTTVSEIILQCDVDIVCM
jgi:hypothetical protein